MAGYGRAPLVLSPQKARQRAGEPNPSLLTEGQKRWRERVGIAGLEAQVARLEAELEAVRKAAIKSYDDGWTDCRLCRTLWRTDVEEEYHTNCPLDRRPKGDE